MAVLDEDSNTEKAKIGVEDYRNGLIPRITLASVESLTLPLVQEIVLLADFRCKGCQEKVATMMSRMNGQTVSIEVSILEKKVTLTCIYPTIIKNPTQVARIHKTCVNKSSLIKRLFRSSCT
ncbi:Polycystic kidney disease [Heracleum sosnowskyi]|uniref:Polycystic kidney disease n=1 Tax=Heracleum sosnowskyi TaxID=360622 RepID=A0AAD8HY26_9APIA|nr:Polycystic kidney disease [Heracleum sosnowskyi]